MHVKLHDVAYAPLLSYNSISLPSLALKGHTYAGDKDEVTLKLKGEKTAHFPLFKKLYLQCGYRPEAEGRVVQTACAVISPGQAKALTTPTDINTFYCTHGHTYEVLRKTTVEQQGVNISGELHECRGCSTAKGLRKPIAMSTHTRANEKLQRVFVDLSGKMPVPSTGRTWYTLIVRDDCPRFTRVYFIGKTSDAARAFESFLAEVRADGTPSVVMAARPDNGRGVFEWDFRKLCRKCDIRQEFTPADSPKYNDVAERALALTNDTALAACPSASIIPGRTDLPVLVGLKWFLGRATS